MAQAQSKQRRVSFIIESTYGVTPTTPTTTRLDFVDFTVDLNPDEIVSQTVQPNRQVSDVDRGNINVTGSFEVELTSDADTFLQAALMGTWATDELTVGETLRSFSFEESYTDIDKHRVVSGAMINTVEMTLTREGYIRAKFGFIAKDVSAFSGTSICASPTEPTTAERYRHSGATFSEGGTAIGSISSMSWNVTNNLEASFVLGSDFARAITADTFTLKGSLTGLFEDVTQYNKFINNTESSLSYTLTTTGSTQTVDIPSLAYSNGKVNNGGVGCLVELDFTGKFSVADATTMLITRT